MSPKPASSLALPAELSSRLRRAAPALGALLAVSALAGCSSSTTDDAGTPDAASTEDAGEALDAASAVDAAAEVHLFINEVAPSNLASCTDEAGEADDWIELYNAGTADVVLDGYALGETIDDPFSGVLSGGLTIPAGGTLLFWADNDTDQGSNHLPFKLSAEGESVVLFSPTRVVLDQVTWTNAQSDVVYARIPDGSGDFRECASSSCGALNGASCTAPSDAGVTPDAATESDADAGT